jgi:hypothetical protein
VREGDSGTNGRWIRAKAKDSFAIMQRARDFPGLGPCWAVMMCMVVLRVGLSGQFWLPLVFSFSKVISNLASKKTCEFNIKCCRGPKIVKSILLSS